MIFRKNAIRLTLLVLLAAMLVGCFAACGKKRPIEETTTPNANDNEPTFLFDRTDYNEDFYFLRTPNNYKNFYFTDIGSDDSDLILSALYERDALVEEYLGVTIHSKTSDGLTDAGMVAEIRNQNMNNTKEYDAVLTHNYLGLTTFISEGLLHDLYEMEEDIDFSADYWNLDVIETLEVKGKAYLALNDFMINSPCAVFFNKRMVQDYQINENLYDLVRDGEWTLDKLFELSSKVAVENGDGVWDKNDTYGLALYADWYALPLVDSCDIQWLTPGPGQRFLTMSASNQKYQTLYEKVQEWANAESTYMWNYGDTENKVNITDDRFLFAFAPVRESYSYRGSTVKFGFLPYPKYDTEQAEYKSSDWSGMLCVPKVLKNDKMVAQTLECLAAFSTDTIRPAYYEKLLGTRLSDERDDSEMITDYIFGHIVFNPVVTYETQANYPLGILVYTIPKMLRYTLNNQPIPDIAQNWAENGDAAQAVIDAFLN